VLLVASAHRTSAAINIWTTHGPYGESVKALAIDPTTPSTLYAGTADGVYQSTDSGGSWTAVNTGLSGDAFTVNVLAIDPITPSTLYAGTAVGVFSIQIQQGAVCIGDCYARGSVTVDEILTMVNIALGNSPISDCLPGDANNDGQITVDEILTAVNNALNGC
jgi:hypothetical protein